MSKNRTFGEAFFEELNSNEYLMKIYDDILFNYAIQVFGFKNRRKRNIPMNDALSFADLLSKSNHPKYSDKHRMWAQEIITMLHYVYPSDTRVSYVAGSVLTSIGNYQGQKIIDSPFDGVDVLDRYLGEFKKEYYSISVTNKSDNGVYSFTMSNPVGYSNWFDQRKRVKSEIQQSAIFESSSVEPVKTKDNEYKLPLQRAIQILKRHRDKAFEKNPDIKPISIIITTLSAQAYCGETGVYDALKKILETMPSYIRYEKGQYYIPNPSNPLENFADKWNSEPEKAKAFYDWLNKAKNDITAVTPFIIDDYSRLEESLGETVVERAISEADPIKHDSDLPITEYNNPKIKSALSVPHRQKPPFKLPKYPMLGIRATITENGVSHPYQNNGPAIPKNCSIDFGLVVSPKLLKGGYTVKWQVVNTGDEARGANGLRGGFETEVNSTKRHESTQYQGTHYVQAFLLKRGKCIAMSREFIVNIK